MVAYTVKPGALYPALSKNNFMKLKTKKTGIGITFVNGRLVQVEDIVEQRLEESLFKQCRKDYRLKLYLLGVVVEASFALLCTTKFAVMLPTLWCGFFLNSFITRFLEIKNN